MMEKRKAIQFIPELTRNIPEQPPFSGFEIVQSAYRDGAR
jgi:hypothetical protein